MTAASLALGRQLDKKSLLALAATSIVDLLNCEVGSVHIFQPDRTNPTFFTLCSDRLVPMMVYSPDLDLHEQFIYASNWEGVVLVDGEQPDG
jgi:hypothetical protein